MPFYDRLCPSCGWLAVDVLEPVNVPVQTCPACGDPTKRAWLTRSTNVIGDEMDHLQVNGLKEPRRFRSKLEHKRWLKENGYTIMDGHVGEYGSDKSKHSSRWAAGGGAEWLANAEELAKRNGASAGKDPEDKPFNIKWSTGTLTPEQVEEYRGKSR